MSRPAEDTRSLSTITIHTLILLLTTILTLAGNSLVCFAFYRNRRLRTITNFYVLSLALVDVVLGMISHPFNAIASGLRRWPFGANFCTFSGFLKFYFSGTSTGILTLAAINRYFCVLKPVLYRNLFTRKKTVVSILLVSIVTFTVSLSATLVPPLVFQWHPYYLFCEVKMDLDVRIDRALTSFLVAGFIVAPTCSIFLCYGSVYCAIRRHNSAVIPSLEEANGQGTVSAQEIKAYRVLLATVIAFFVCWSPAAIVRVLQRVVHITVPPFWQSLHTLAASCSTWINPIIYGVINRAMRKECLKLLRCRKEN